MNSVSTSPTSTGPSNAAMAWPSIRRFGPLAIAIVWTFVIMGLCWIPGRLVREFDPNSIWVKIPNLDKYIHAGIFIVFSVLWMRVGNVRWRFATVFVAGCALAVLTEVVQELAIVGRDGNIPDTTVDCAGVIIGLAIAGFLPFKLGMPGTIDPSGRSDRDDET